MVSTKNKRTPRLLARLKSFLLLPLHLAGISLISSLPLRERIKVRGAVKIFSSSFFTLHLRERARVRGVVFFLFLFFSISQGQIIEINQLNVDQGDACFLRIDTFKILIDGANATKGNNIINPYLSALGINKLNFTVASHHHADHIGGLDEVILRFNPDVCYDRGESYSSYQFSEYITAVGPRRRTPAVAETLINISNPHGKIVLSVFAVSGHIRKDGYAGTSDENTQSIALLLEFVSTNQDTFKFFTAGDLYARQESILVVKNPELENVHLMKISHHGSNTSTPQILLDKLKPLAVFISVGENNSYGHPHTETLLKLQNAESVRFVYQTTAGSHTTAKSIIAGHITAKVFDRFFTITTSNNPTHIDTFYFSKDRTLNAEDEPFKKPFEKDKRGEKKMMLKTTRNGSFTTLEISTPGEIMRRVAIFNILGQLVQEMNPNADYTSLTIPNTASGVYLISVFTNRNIYNDKFIITK
jgi:beta-lactamase superfamily II metal-dependent hydrolase